MAAITIAQAPDGRHAVMNQDGSVLGLHNSLASAQRQMQDYYQEPGQAQTKSPVQSPGPPMQPGGGNGSVPQAPGQQQMPGQMYPGGNVNGQLPQAGSVPNPVMSGAPVPSALGGVHPGMSALGAYQQPNAAAVDLVHDRMDQPWGAHPDSVAQLQAAYNAFHPQQAQAPQMGAGLGAGLAAGNQQQSMNQGQQMLAQQRVLQQQLAQRQNQGLR